MTSSQHKLQACTQCQIALLPHKYIRKSHFRVEGTPPDALVGRASEMFTGIVETIGTVASIDQQDESSGGGWTIWINVADIILADAKNGDSIAVNGTCLTITALGTKDNTKHSFKVGVAPETRRRTNLGNLRPGSSVNLEASCKPSTRLGGHYVQGHVDTVAEILSVTQDGEALVFRFKPRDSSLLRYVVEKGYICIDGASLTITAVGTDWFEIMLIAYTQTKIVTAKKGIGEEVNIEVDMMAKYVEKGLDAYFGVSPGKYDHDTRLVEADGVGLEPRPSKLESLIGNVVDRKLQERAYNRE